MHLGNSDTAGVVLLLFFVVYYRVGVSVHADAHAHTGRNAKAQTGTMFLGLPENDVQVVWGSKSRDALRRNIRSPIDEEGTEGSGGGFGLVLADEDGGSTIGEGVAEGSGSGDEGSGSESGTGSGDGNNEPESIESFYSRYWAKINCSDPLHMQLLNSTAGGGGNLPPDYNKFELPQQTNPEEQKVWVWLRAGIQSIADIDETKGEITLEMDVLIGWWDDVVWTYALRKQKCNGGNYSNVIEEQQKVLDHSFLDSIWKPDIFIDNLVSVKRPQLLVPPTGLKFSPNGQMTYTTRVKIKIQCDFNFGFYPADTQKCDVVFRSYSHNASVVGLVWSSNDTGAGAYLFDLSNDNFDVAIGSLERYRLVAGGRQDKTNETFDCLQFTVSARRRLSYHLIQTYVPSMLYIAITWLCFMVPRRMIEARMAIVMTTLLSLTAMFSSVRESTPIVSYTKAIDIWMVACIVFVFAVLLQFSLLLWTETRKDEAEAEEKRAGVQDDTENSNSKEGRRRAKKPTPTPSGLEQWFLNTALEMSSVGVEFIEAHSFFFVLCVFIVFNILYWSSLLYMSGYYEWRVDSRNNAVDSPADNFTAKYPYP